MIANCCICCGHQELKKSPAILMPFVAHRALEWRSVSIDESWQLETVQHGKAYPICNSLLCMSCGLIFLDIRFDDAAMARLYNNYRGIEYTELREHYEPGYKHKNDILKEGSNYIDYIESWISSKICTAEMRILDWGGDMGINTPFRYSAAAIDIYDISGNSPQVGTLVSAQQQQNSGHYDLVVCSNVLEHTPYPKDILKEISRFMSNESVLYIEVPHELLMKTNSDKMERLSKKKHWHEHINFFTPSSLEKLIERSGYEIIDFIEKSFDSTEMKSGLYMILTRLRFQNRDKPG
jgi:hypothetical protein